MNTSPFTPYINKRKKKDPAEDLKKTQLVENKQEVQQPRRLNINTETQLEAMDKQVEREQKYNLVDRGGITAREWTNADGSKLYTKAPQNEQPMLGDMSQQPKPTSELKYYAPEDLKTEQPANPDDLTDPNNPKVQENAMMNEGLRKAGEVFDRFDIPEQEIYESRADQFSDQFELQNARAGLKAEELDFLEEQEVMRLEEMQRQVQGAIGANRASFSQSREGVQATSMDMVRTQFEEEINKQLDARVKQHGMILKDINLKRRELEVAKKAGNTELAASLAEQLASAQDQLRSNEIQYIDALGRQIDQQLKIDNQMMQKFEMTYGMMANGQQFSQDQLIGMANEFGLPAEMMLSTYQSLEQVRNDKSLSEQQKIAETQNILLDSEMRAKGLFSEKQQSASMLVSRFQAGELSREEVENYMMAMDIPHHMNPITNAERALEKLELEKTKRQLNGQPTSLTEQIAYEQAIRDARAMSGENLAYMPTQSTEGITWTATDDGILVDDSVIENGRFHCGSFVNRTFGLPNGGDYMGSKIEDKLDNITVPTSRINELNVYDLVKPGMAFVQELSGAYSEFGHTGIVESVNYDAMSVNVVQGQTIKVNGKDVPGPVTRSTIPISMIAGFAHPPAGKAEPVGGGVAKINNIVQSATPVLTQLVSKDQKATVSAEIQRLAESGDTGRLQDYVKTTVFNSLTADQSNKLWLRNNIVGKDAELKKLLEQYQGDMGIFEGSLIDMKNKIGQMADPEQQEIAQLIRLNLEDFGRAQTGAAIQDFESKNFKKILPDIYDGKELAIAKIESFANAVEIDVNSTLRFKLGDSVYNDVFGVKEAQPEQEDEDISYFNSTLQRSQEAEERSFFDNL